MYYLYRKHVETVKILDKLRKEWVNVILYNEDENIIKLIIDKYVCPLYNIKGEYRVVNPWISKYYPPTGEMYDTALCRKEYLGFEQYAARDLFHCNNYLIVLDGKLGKKR